MPPAWTCLLSGNASYTDSKRQSGTSTQRRWPDGQNPRPAGLGEAGRPPSGSSRPFIAPMLQVDACGLLGRWIANLDRSLR